MSKPLVSERSGMDEWIISGLISGNRQALESLYQIHFPPVLHMIIRNSGTEDDAKDIFQEAVCVLYDKVHHSDFHLSSQLKTYLYAVSRRLWLKQLKVKNISISNEEGLDETASIDSDLIVHHQKEVQFENMERSLEKLGDPCKSILTDFYIKGKTMQEISDLHNYSNADNAKNQKYKCLQRLKKLFFEEL